MNTQDLIEIQRYYSIVVVVVVLVARLTDVMLAQLISSRTRKMRRGEKNADARKHHKVVYSRI
jgi:hypothetical protein